MNFLDIIFIIPIIWFAYQGFKRGLIIELASLVALILGIYAALYFSFYAENFLTKNMSMDSDYVPTVAFIITFLIVVIIVYFIGKILEKVISMVALGFLNKMAGGFFGILKAAVLISIVLLIINNFSEKFISKEKKENSFLYAPIAGIAPLIWQSLKDFDNEHLEKFKEDVEESVTI